MGATGLTREHPPTPTGTQTRLLPPSNRPSGKPHPIVKHVHELLGSPTPPIPGQDSQGRNVPRSRNGQSAATAGARARGQDSVPRAPGGPPWDGGVELILGLRRVVILTPLHLPQHVPHHLRRMVLLKATQADKTDMPTGGKNKKDITFPAA